MSFTAIITMMIARNDSRTQTRKASHLLTTIVNAKYHPHGLNDTIFFYLHHHLIHSIYRFCRSKLSDKSVCSSVVEHWSSTPEVAGSIPSLPGLGVAYFAPPSSFTDRLIMYSLMTYSIFASYPCICYCFSHLFGLRSCHMTKSLLYKYHSFFYLFYSISVN